MSFLANPSLLLSLHQFSPSPSYYYHCPPSSFTHHSGTFRYLCSSYLLLLCGAPELGEDMWQSRVEIEGYSVAYFDRIVAYEAPYC